MGSRDYLIHREDGLFVPDAIAKELREMKINEVVYVKELLLEFWTKVNTSTMKSFDANYNKARKILEPEGYFFIRGGGKITRLKAEP